MIGRVLFLDFDGVLHPVDLHAAPYASTDPTWTRVEIGRRNLFRFTHLLAELLEDHPDVRLVVHSSWRLHFTPQFFRDECLGPALAHRFDTTTDPCLGRFESIQVLVEGLRIGPEHYRVLDDDRDSFARGCPQLILTDPTKGLDDSEVLAKLRAWLSETRPASDGRAT